MSTPKPDYGKHRLSSKHHIWKNNRLARRLQRCIMASPRTTCTGGLAGVRTAKGQAAPKGVHNLHQVTYQSGTPGSFQEGLALALTAMQPTAHTAPAQQRARLGTTRRNKESYKQRFAVQHWVIDPEKIEFVRGPSMPQSGPHSFRSQAAPTGGSAFPYIVNY